ncbi:MAG: SoxR reducing system RseC family protein [Bacteroidales bacterium]|nr:SoxR reducing system RseC family protein [Bacteroidales bacterium]
MDKTKIIEHKGIVKKIDNDHILVSIITNTSCASCEVKGTCSASELEEKEIEVRSFTEKYHVGEQVLVYFKESLGFKALFLGYILPFLVLMIVLISTTTLGYTEAIAGLLALASLIPYYLIIYLMNKKIRKVFSFSIRKINTNELVKNAEFTF